MKFRAGLSCGVALGALLAAAGGATAEDFVVPAGPPVGQQVLPGPGDTLLIEIGGSIEVSGSVFGVWMQNDNQSVTNNGDVTALEGYGIYSTEADAEITNNGNITAYWGGILANGAGVQVTNNGNITSLGGEAILADGGQARVTNSGNIIASGVNDRGILAGGAGAQVTNSGNITTTALGGQGIYTAVGADHRITNSGNITTLGGNSIGIRSRGDNADITNTGVITTWHESAGGIRAEVASATVTNSGWIISHLNSYAIFFDQQDATLNLLAGSVIQGDIRFSMPDTATLNIGPGLNAALTFTGLPTTINTFGAPMAVQGNLVAVIDPTGFSAQDEMLTDLTRAIAGAVDGRLNAARFGYVPMASSVTAYAEADTQPTAFGYATGTSTASSTASSTEGGFWAAGIGSWRNQDADGPNVGFDTALGGLLVGYDTHVSGSTRVGGFLGASASRFENDANSQEIDADSYYGGLYAGFTGESYFLDVSVTGGVSHQSSDRTVANNLEPGGIEHAKAKYDGVFISPSATIGTTFAMANGNGFVPSLRARYAGLFLDSYEESGSAANLSVEDRDVNIFDFRAQLAYALASLPLGNGNLHTTFRVGADATFADNDNVDAALLGTALNFDVSGDDTLRGFAGIDLNYRTDSGTSFFIGAEAGYDSGDAFTLDVQGGLRVRL
ncbi:MAG: autotransporter domain-containing protein [Rhizobiaceae bacterium]|nr:autotransporter domain-containing protein [Rhizobiaceae bacterium]